MIRRSLIVRLDRWDIDLDPLRYEGGPDAFLHLFQVLGGHGVGLGDDGDQVGAGGETLHGLDIEGLQASPPDSRETEEGLSVQDGGRGEWI